MAGGSTPDQSIPTILAVVTREHAAAAARALRSNDPPIVARVAEGALLLDLRTVFPGEEPALQAAVQALPGAP